MRHPCGYLTLDLCLVPFRMVAAQRFSDHALGELPEAKGDIQPLSWCFPAQDFGHCIIENFIGEALAWADASHRRCSWHAITSF
jgi:hypothetical protein